MKQYCTDELSVLWATDGIESVLEWLSKRNNNAHLTSISSLSKKVQKTYEDTVRIVRVLEEWGFAEFERRRGFQKSRVRWHNGAFSILQTWAAS
jgi:hypothetical protein